MKKVASILLIGAMIMGMSSAFAQLGGLGRAVGIGGSSGGSVSPQKIVRGYVKGQGFVLTGQQSMIRALDLKTDEARMVLEAKALTEKPTKSEVEASKTVVENGSKILAEGMQSQAGEMSEESKKEFSEGVAALALGLREYVNVGADARNFKPGVSNLDSTAVAAVTIAPTLPSAIETLSTTLKASIQFMQDHDMPPLEKNATAGLPGF